jgi:hypothetical protein
MSERGYPVDDFDRRAADISVDHPTVVENYRALARKFLPSRIHVARSRRDHRLNQ